MYADFGMAHAMKGRDRGIRTGFWEVFQSHADGSLSAKMFLRIGAMTFAPRELVPPALRVGDVTLGDLIGKDLIAEWGHEAVLIHREA